jgi:hypothetical protein
MVKKLLFILLFFSTLANAQVHTSFVLRLGLPQGLLILPSGGTGEIIIDTTNHYGTGSVLSVGLSMPSIFTVSGSPITTTGTLSATLNSQSANLVLASPNGSSGTPTFRSLVAADIPSLPYGTGTVTTVSVVTAHGLSGSVATATTTPAITLTPDSASFYSLLGLGTASKSATSAFLQPSNNLSDVTTANTALNNLLPSQSTHSGLFLQTNGTNTSWVAGNAGTVTTFSTIVNNGLTQSVSNPTTTPALTLGIANGSIGDTSLHSTFLKTAVTSVGVSGANGINIISGSPVTTTGTIALGITNGGIGDTSLHSTFLKANQSITLSGNVTGTGATAITTTIADSAVTLPMINALTGTSRLLGSSASSNAVQALSLGTGLSMSGTTLNGTAAPVGANPTQSLGLSIVNGSAATFMRSDAAPAIDQTIAPTWTGVHNFNSANITTTYTTQINLENTTASLSGTHVQQSPSLEFLSHVWSTTATAHDSTRAFDITLVPVSSANPLVSNLVFRAGNGGTNMNEVFGITNTGQLRINGSLLNSGIMDIDASGNINITALNGAGEVCFASNTYQVGTGSDFTWSESGGLFVRPFNNGTNSVITTLSLLQNSNGTPTTGFGGAILMGLKSSTTFSRSAAQIAWDWVTPTDASRAGEMTFWGVFNASALTKIATLALAGATTSTLTLGVASSTLGNLALAGNTSGTITITPSATAGTQTYTIRDQGAAANFVLSNTSGGNASCGTATLSSGTVTVSTTFVAANSLIFLTDATTGSLTNVGSQTVSTIIAGTSFVIKSTNPLDASNVNWLIVNP